MEVAPIRYFERKLEELNRRPSVRIEIDKYNSIPEMNSLYRLMEKMGIEVKELNDREIVVEFSGEKRKIELIYREFFV